MLGHRILLITRCSGASFLNASFGEVRNVFVYLLRWLIDQQETASSEIFALWERHSDPTPKELCHPVFAQYENVE